MHLAALGGHTAAVEMLVECGHPVDTVDNAGWPPLLYANFQANEQCVLSLLNAKPDHLRVLGVLLRQTTGTDDQRRRNRKVVASVVTSLATHDSYYKVLNDIVRGDPGLLDREFRFLLRQKGLLDFENKVQWFRNQVASIRDVSHGSVDWSSRSGAHVEVYREHPFESVHQSFNVAGHRGTNGRHTGSTGFNGSMGFNAPAPVDDVMLRQQLSVSFYNEPGVMLGPLRELFELLPAEICKPERMLFTATAREEGVFMPTAVWSEVITIEDDGDGDGDGDDDGEAVSGAGARVGGGGGGGGRRAAAAVTESAKAAAPSGAMPGGRTAERPDRLEELGTVGLLIGLALWHGHYLNLKLSPVCVAQLLGKAVKHPADLEHVDPVMFQSMMWVAQNDPEPLELVFSDDVEVVAEAQPRPRLDSGGQVSGWGRGNAAARSGSGGGCAGATAGTGAAAGGGTGAGADATHTAGNPGGETMTATTTMVTVALDQTGTVHPDTPVTKQNASQYVRMMSELRLEYAISAEVEALKRGMLRVRSKLTAAARGRRGCTATRTNLTDLDRVRAAPFRGSCMLPYIYIYLFYFWWEEEGSFQHADAHVAVVKNPKCADVTPYAA